MLLLSKYLSLLRKIHLQRNERYGSDSTSQGAAVSNDCLNPIFDSNTIDNAISVGNGGT